MPVPVSYTHLYLKKSGCKVVLMTCNPELDIKIPIDHTILLGQSKNRKTGKHSLLTAVESVPYTHLLVVGVTKSYQPLKQLKKRQVGAIVFSAIATGMSWLCYFAALKDGPASIVVPIYKLSIVVSILFASFVLHEKQNIKTIFGLICIVASTLLLLIA